MKIEKLEIYVIVVQISNMFEFGNVFRNQNVYQFTALLTLMYGFFLPVMLD